MDNLVFDMEQAFDYSEEKIFGLLEEKKYFQCRDELLKFNEVDIAEMLQDVMREYDMQKAVILFRTLPKDISVEVFAHSTSTSRSRSSTSSPIPKSSTSWMNSTSTT